MYYSPEKRKIITSNNVRNEFNISFSGNSGKNITSDIANLLGLVKLKAKDTPEIIEGYQTLIPDYSVISYTEGDNFAYYSYKVNEIYPPVVDESGNVVKTREQVKAESEERKKQLEDEAAAINLIQSRTEHFTRLVGQRNGLLAETDKFSLPDWPHASDEVKQSWITYRQSLRTMFDDYRPFDPEQTDPKIITFPTRPDQVQESE